MFIVYVIYNKQFRKSYTGFTNDLDKRLDQHNEEFTGSFTSRFKGGWMLIYSEQFTSETEARQREKQLKSYQGRQSIKRFIPE